MSNPIYWFITKPADSETAKKNKKTGQHPYRKRGSIAMAIILLGVVLGVFAGLIPDGLKEELTQFAGYIRLSYTHFWLISFLGLTSILLIFVWWEAKINVREEVVEKSRPSVLPTKKQLIPNEPDSFTTPSFSTQSALSMYNHQEVQNSIRENKLEEVFTYLNKHITDADRDNLAILERRYSQLASDSLHGVISDDEKTRRNNQLARDLLTFSRTIKEDHSPQTLLSLKPEPKTLASMPQPQPKTITI
ncbi:MAG TPA: hypothetical protein DIW24_08930, partial [Bacteroidetes bacterium]|nr:hypothetical protein [Bacteroidota bacterium]